MKTWTAWMIGAADLDGNPRLFGTRVDMGAYEFFVPAGIPADWQGRFGLPTNGSMDYWDSDLDGWLNWEEYQADTNPTNGESFFPPLTNVEGIDVLTITTPSTSTGRVYDVFCKTNLVPESEAWNSLDRTTAGNGRNVVFVVTNTVPECYFRTGVRVP